MGNDLKTYIIKEVMVLFLVTIALIGSYDFYQNKRALTQFSHEYVDKYSEFLTSLIETRMKEPAEANELITLWLQKIRNVDEFRPDQIKYLKYIYKIFEGASTLNIALENGDMLHFHTPQEFDTLRNNPEKKLPFNVKYCIITIRNQDGKPYELLEYYNKNDRLVLSETVSKSSYDPRLRQWYIDAKSSKEVRTETSVSESIMTKEQVIKTASPLLDSNNNVWGVIATNLSLKALSQLLKDNVISPGSILFIVDNKQNIVASSNLELVSSVKELEETPLIVNQLKDNLYKKAHEIYKQDKEERFQFTTNGKTYIADFTRFKESFYDTFGKKWMFVSLVPFDEVFSVFLQSQQDSFGIYLFAFILVLLRIIILSRKLSEPIEELTEEANKIRDFQFEGDVKIDSKIKEVRTLTHTMQTMKVSLKSFTKYMPRRLVMRLLEKNQDIQLGGESKKLTIMFTDVAGFTTVSEGMTPQALMTHISDYFEQLTQIIIHQGGTIDKYIGDAIMAFWGAPDEDTLRSFHACRAALLCQHALETLNANWLRQSKPVLNTRMGIHCGEVVVGNMGSSERMNYTLIGDAVNLSSRLEGTNKFYGTKIIVSHAVYEEVKDDFLCRIMDIVAVKGKNKGIKIYELLGQRNAEAYLTPTQGQEDFVAAFDKAFEFYLKMNWEKALSSFEQLLGTLPSCNETLKSYIERCQLYLKTPPGDDWDGVYHLTSK